MSSLPDRVKQPIFESPSGESCEIDIFFIFLLDSPPGEDPRLLPGGNK